MSSCWNIGFIFLSLLITYLKCFMLPMTTECFYLFSDQNIPSSFLCRVVLLCINSFIMFYYRNFLSLFILIGNYAGYIDLCWQSFRTSSICFLVPKVLEISVKQSDVFYYGCYINDSIFLSCSFSYSFIFSLF